MSWSTSSSTFTLLLSSESEHWAWKHRKHPTLKLYTRRPETELSTNEKERWQLSALTLQALLTLSRGAALSLNCLLTDSYWFTFTPFGIRRHRLTHRWSAHTHKPHLCWILPQASRNPWSGMQYSARLFRVDFWLGGIWTSSKFNVSEAF